MDATNSSASSDEKDKSLFAVGAFLALLAGACLALSMVIQRYALSYPTYRVPLMLSLIHI